MPSSQLKGLTSHLEKGHTSPFKDGHAAERATAAMVLPPDTHLSENLTHLLMHLRLLASG